VTNLLRLIDRISPWLLGPWRPASIVGYVVAVVFLCGSLAVIGLRITAQTNHEIDPFDQGAYVGMSKTMEGSWYPWYSDGTRNPLFPWLAAILLDPNDAEFFEKGKQLNVALAILATAAVSAFFASRVGPLAALNSCALCSLAALLPISTFFGAEPIFLVLFLFVCACAMRLLNENPLPLYLLLGVLTALAWLAKSSTTPFFVLFLGFSIVRWLLSLSFGEKMPWHLRAPGWRPGRFLAGLLICLAAYFAIIAPRLVHAHKTWGSAFYNLPSFWFWADDWETCVNKYADCRQVRLATLPIEEQPTMQGYFQRHDLGDALVRLTNGVVVRLVQLFHPEAKWRLSVERKDKPKRIVLPHRGLYLIGLAALALVMCGVAASQGRLEKLGPITLPVLLSLTTFLVYLMATGWYVPTGPGHRFIMTLYMPLLWLVVQGGDQLRAISGARLANWLYLAGHLAISVLLLSRVVELLQDTRFEKISYAF
jgi:hypothetical protein